MSRKKSKGQRVRRPEPLTKAERATLSRILKKARASKAFKRATSQDSGSTGKP